MSLSYGAPPRDHELDASVVHRAFDNSLEPRLWIDSGDTVVFQVRGGGDGVYTRDSNHDDILRHRFVGHPLTGPIGIHGAQPGDVLQIEILALQTWDWGFTTVVPGRGLLPDDFPDPYFQLWDLSDRRHAFLTSNIAVPIEPFHGVLGLAPAELGVLSTIPPRRSGGNLDVKHLTAGSVLWLPVEVEGALFSVGDAHAAQGDGEVCVTAIETGMTSTLRFTLCHEMRLDGPQFRTAPWPTSITRSGPCHGTVGVGPDLRVAAQDATRAMIRFLTDSYGIAREQAYVLANVAVDLKISQIVNAPNWTVAAVLPLDIFL